jgi:hypothetical protein
MLAHRLAWFVSLGQWLSMRGGMVEFLGSWEDKNFTAKIWPIMAENGGFRDFSISLVVIVNNF